MNAERFPDDDQLDELRGLLVRLEPHLREKRREVVRRGQGVLRRRYIAPAGPYDEMWDWDMYFTGLALVRANDPQPLENSILNFLDFTAPDGHTPRMIAPSGPLKERSQCKPFLAQGALAVSLAFDDFDWIRPVLAKLERTLAYWHRERRTTDGLFVWHDALESGSTNNPAVVGRPERSTVGVDCCCFVAREQRALIELAQLVGDRDLWSRWRRKTVVLWQEGIAKLWDEDAGSFFNRDAATDEPIRVHTWTNLLPLWAKTATEDQAERLVEEHLLNPNEFWSPNGVRSLSKSEPLCNQANGAGPMSNWQGPVWPLVNYLVAVGLRNYGHAAASVDLAIKTCRLLLDDLDAHGHMHACYEADTGEPLAAPGFVSWNLLAGEFRQWLPPDAA